jgi:hypothetical protein
MRLSYSSLSTFLDCPRCFYLEKKYNTRRPDGIKSSMPTAVDEILKGNLDPLRTTGDLPAGLLALPEITGWKLLSDRILLKKMRHWNSNPYKVRKNQYELIGAFDDCLVKDGMMAMLDYKTTGKEPGADFALRYYQKQVNIYTAQLEGCGIKTPGFGVLLFFWPAAGDNGTLQFKSKGFVIPADPGAALALMDQAIACLEAPHLPASGGECAYCKYENEKRGLGF